MEIEFLENEHIYLINGVITPSVSQLLKALFPDTYKNVPKYILERAREHGTAVHEAIEIYEQGIEFNDELKVGLAVLDYEYIKNENNIEVLEQEQMIHYKNIYAGRYDMLATVNGKRSLIDIKTTYNVDKEYLSWQLGLYNYALKEKAEKFYCIWLPKRKSGELIEIKIKSDKEIKEFLKGVK